MLFSNSLKIFNCEVCNKLIDSSVMQIHEFFLIIFSIDSIIAPNENALPKSWNKISAI